MRLLTCILTIAAFRFAAADEPKIPKGFTVPGDSVSPDKRFGVTVPIRAQHGENAKPKNSLIEIKTGRVLAIIPAETGWDRMNHGGVMPARWSKDGSLLLWKVDGKWFHDAFVLIKIADGKVAWQTDILKAAQQEILARTRKAAPAEYAVAKQENEGSGSAYPEGFSVDVDVAGKGGITLPLKLKVVLSSNPKGIEGVKSLYSHMDAEVDADGCLVVKKFTLGHFPLRNL